MSLSTEGQYIDNGLEFAGQEQYVVNVAAATFVCVMTMVSSGKSHIISNVGYFLKHTCSSITWE